MVHDPTVETTHRRTPHSVRTLGSQPAPRRRKLDDFRDLSLIPDNTTEQVVCFGSKEYVPALRGPDARRKGERIVFYNSVTPPNTARREPRRRARGFPQELSVLRARSALAKPRVQALRQGLEKHGRQGQGQDQAAPPRDPGARRRDRARDRRVPQDRADGAEGRARSAPGEEGDGGGEPTPRDLDRQEIHKPRPAVPRPDPGRQHRPDEGGRQVRLSPRLQVLDLWHLVDPAGAHPLDLRPGPHHPYPRAHDRVINKIVRTSRQMLNEIGREPTPEELAGKLGMLLDKVRRVLKIAKEPLSLETPVGDEEDTHLGDFIEDKNAACRSTPPSSRTCARPRHACSPH